MNARTTINRVAMGGLAMALFAATLACGDSDEDATTTTTTAAPPSTTAFRTEVKVFLTTPQTGDPDCGLVAAAPRTVEGPNVLAATMTALLAGPTAAERDSGYTSWFSDQTAGMLISARTDGVARVDFEDFSALIPNASSSCGSQSLLAQLDRTATQSPGVDRAVYSFEGDTSRFYEWLQLAAPDE